MAGVRLRVSGGPGGGILDYHFLCWCAARDEGERVAGVLTVASVKLAKDASSHVVEQMWWGVKK